MAILPLRSRPSRWTTVLRPVGLLVLAGLLVRCDSDPGESLFDPDAPFAPDPVISQIEPDGAALSGVDIMTLSGQNFSADPEMVRVYFDETPGVVLEATPTQLRVQPPNTPGPALNIRVMVVGAENFSNGFTYALEPASEPFGNIGQVEEPFGITVDADDNLYVSLFSGGLSAGIKRITPDGDRTDFVDSRFKWDDLAFGPDGALYGARNIRALFRLPSDADQQTFAVVADRSVTLRAIVFDADGNLWAGGDNAHLYRIDPAGTITEFPFEANVRSLAVFDGHLYAGARVAEAAEVWRFPLSPTGIGAGELHASLPAPYASAAPVGLAFSTEGDLFIATNATPNPVLLMPAGGTPEALYPGILAAPGVSLAWGDDPWLYMSTAETGSRGPGLVRINTRREGAP